MVVASLDAELGPDRMDRDVRAIIGEAPADAVLRLRVRGPMPGWARHVLGAGRLRALAPFTMNVDVVTPDADTPRGRRRRAYRVTGSPG